MRSGVQDKIAIITGGASGIGKATVFRFCQDGARVMVGDIDVEAGERLMTEVMEAGFGEQVEFRQTDVSVEADVASLVGATVARFGDLDVVVNNAAVHDSVDPLVTVSLEHWESMFAINARSVFLGIKYGALAMQAAGHGGVIVNTASVDGLVPSSGFPSYSAAKAAVINLTQAAAVELAPSYIRVNALCPGGVLTPMLARGDVESARRWLTSLQPWPEAGVPEDIAGVVAFLASDDARFITGQAIVVDGGLLAAGARTRNQIVDRLNSLTAPVAD